MEFQIYYKGSFSIGKVNIFPDKFELSGVGSPAHYKKLTDFLKSAYADGIKSWLNGDIVQESPLKSTAPQFPLVLAEKLVAEGYLLK